MSTTSNPHSTLGSATNWTKDKAKGFGTEAQQSLSHGPAETTDAATKTPGSDIPGAFPQQSERLSVQTNGGEVGPTTSGHPAEGSLVDTAIEKAKGFIPEPFRGYLPGGNKTQPRQEHSTSLPTQELHGDTSGRTDGVGALPGEIDEAGVVLTPEERARVKPDLGLGSAEAATAPGRYGEPIPHQTAVTVTDDTIRDLPPHEEGGSPVHTLPESAVREQPLHAVSGEAETTTNKAYIPFATDPSNLATTSPSKPTADAVTAEKTAQIKEAEGVAGTQGSKRKGSTAAASGIGVGGSGVGVAKNGKSVDPVAPTADTPKVSTEHSATAESSPPAPGSSKQKTGTNPFVRSSEADKSTSTPPPTTTTTTTEATAQGPSAKEQPSTPPTSPDRATATSEASGGSAASKKKAGFMDKIRGEVKILSGRMSHDEKKIEDGKRMMGRSI